MDKQPLIDLVAQKYPNWIPQDFGYELIFKHKELAEIWVSFDLSGDEVEGSEISNDESAPTSTKDARKILDILTEAESIETISL